MNDDNKNALQRINPSRLMAELVSLEGLTPEKQMEIRAKLADNAVEMVDDMNKRLLKSKTAENDMAVTMDHIKDLDHNKKIYSVNQDFETGAGKVKINVKGGDVNFIIPVLIVVGLIILGLVFILNNK